MARIFKDLECKDICYAVCKAISNYEGLSNHINSRSYFLIGSKADEAKLRRLGFRNSEKMILERDLTVHEIESFKESIDKYVKVLQNNDGKVYELLNNSFKEYHKEQIELNKDAWISKQEEKIKKRKYEK